MEIYRWDLDKTYLETDFDSVRGLVRSAIEAPEEKRNVPGSAALLRALSRRPGARVVILSGSQTQMREVLTQKLRLDGVNFSELHLKDNVRNLRRGRLRAIKGQFGYKLPALLSGRVGLGQAVTEHLFGDDAEIDAVVYSVFADAVAGRLTPVELSRIMEAAGAYPDTRARAVETLDNIATAEAVERIFIRLEKGVPPQRFAPLGSRLVPVYSWFQAALVLYGAGRLDAAAVRAVAIEVGKTRGHGPRAIANLFQDIVRRGHVPLEAMERLVEELGPGDVAPVVVACRRRVGWLHNTRCRTPAAPRGLDYVALLKSFK